MPDNPQTSKAAWFSLPDHRLVSLSGRDALAFAHAQTMNDVAALDDGMWQWNGWLTPKGRVVALFALIRIDNHTVWMLLPDADADAFVAQLRRFLFRSKVAIAVRDDLHAAGRLQASDLASGNHWVNVLAAAVPGASLPDAIELDLSGNLDGGHSGRSLRIAAAFEPPPDAVALEQWRRIDLEHGWPRLDASQSEQWTPQQLSLERLRAYSVKKGCYPGQEIVARTHFLGQAKRGLGLIRSATPLQPGADVLLGEAKLGAIVSVAGDTALAVVGLDASNPSLRIEESPAAGGASWESHPLRSGLAR